MSTLFGQPMVVENKPGAAGTLATGLVERAAPDGYTILMNASGAYIHTILKTGNSYDPLAVCTPIAAVTKAAVVMLVNNSLPVHSVSDFVKLARQEENLFSYGSDGVAGTTQLCGEYFSRLAGVKLLHVPFKGVVDIIETLSGGEAKPELARALAKTGARLISWLQGQGAKFMRFNPQEGYRWCMSPPRALRGGLDWEKRGPDLLLRQLASILVELGGKLQLCARAKALLMQEGHCVGVRGVCDGRQVEWPARYCVLAVGGFQASRSLVEQYITPRFDALFQRGAGNSRSDGLRMAQVAGAALTDCSRFYGHLLCSDARRNGQVWPYPEIDAIATAGIVVDSSGRRCVDEGRPGVTLANELASCADLDTLFAVFDTFI